MAFLYIDRVGVEIEGGWERSPENYTGDGSVCCGGNVTGESVSPPYRRFSTLETYVRQNWPGIVDATCGYHIHTSFTNNKMYSRLMEPDFAADALAFWENWARLNNVRSSHRFWNRLRGENRYCRVEVDSLPVMEQSLARGKSGPRYYFLNFCHTAHKTMELRLLPAWKEPDMAVKSLTDWLAFLENWLSNHSLDCQIVEPLFASAGEPLVICENLTVKEHIRAGYRNFVVGDRVSVTGEIDGREFEGEVGTVSEIIARDGRYKIRVTYDRGFSWYGLDEENEALRSI